MNVKERCWRTSRGSCAMASADFGIFVRYVDMEAAHWIDIDGEGSPALPCRARTYTSTLANDGSELNAPGLEEAGDYLTPWAFYFAASPCLMLWESFLSISWLLQNTVTSFITFQFEKLVLSPYATKAVLLVCSRIGLFAYISTSFVKSLVASQELSSQDDLDGEGNSSSIPKASGSIGLLVEPDPSENAILAPPTDETRKFSGL